MEIHLVVWTPVWGMVFEKLVPIFLAFEQYGAELPISLGL